MEELNATSIDGMPIERTIGEGGMGRVVLAVGADGASVAVKVLAPHHAGNEEMRQRFVREAEALIGVDSPHVVRGVRWGEDDEAGLFLTMEHLVGETLAERIARTGPLSLEAALRWTAQAARGLKAAVDAGLIHRDIKPDNLIVTDEGVLKVIDFGLARAIDGSGKLTAAGLIVGSPAYVAPERCRGEEATVKSDLYALGCTLFEMLAGRPPFEGPTEIKTLSAHITEPVPDVREARPEVPDALAELVGRLLEKDPDQRVGRYEAVLAVVDRIAADLPPPDAAAPAASAPSRPEEAEGAPASTSAAPAQEPVEGAEPSDTLLLSADEIAAAAEGAQTPNDRGATEDAEVKVHQPLDEASGAAPNGQHPVKVWVDATGGLLVWAGRQLIAHKLIAAAVGGLFLLVLLIVVLVAAFSGGDEDKAGDGAARRSDYPEDDIRGWNVKELTAYLGDDDIDDILDELAERDPDELKAPLEALIHEGSYLRRHRALSLLEEKDLATDAHHQAVALQDIDNGPSCAARSEGLDRLVEHAVDDKALEALERLKRRRSINGCMNLSEAEEAIKDRLE